MSALGRGYTSYFCCSFFYTLWRKKSTCVGMSGLARRLPGRWEWENGPAFVIIGKNAASREFIEYRARKRMDTRRRGGMKYSDDDADRSKACAYPTLATTIRYHIMRVGHPPQRQKRSHPLPQPKISVTYLHFYFGSTMMYLRNPLEAKREACLPPRPYDTSPTQKNDTNRQ